MWYDDHFVFENRLNYYQANFPSHIYLMNLAAIFQVSEHLNGF